MTIHNNVTLFLKQAGLNSEQLQEFLRLQTVDQTKDKEWLSPPEFYQEYRFSESTQAKYRMQRKIPFSKIGKYIRYKRSDIEAWLESNKMEVM